MFVFPNFIDYVQVHAALYAWIHFRQFALTGRRSLLVATQQLIGVSHILCSILKVGFACCRAACWLAGYPMVAVQAQTRVVYCCCTILLLYYIAGVASLSTVQTFTAAESGKTLSLVQDALHIYIAGSGCSNLAQLRLECPTCWVAQPSLPKSFLAFVGRWPPRSSWSFTQLCFWMSTTPFVALLHCVSPVISCSIGDDDAL